MSRALCRCILAAAAVLLIQASTASVANAAPAGESRRVGLGAYIPDSWQPRRIDRYARMVGRMPVIISSYKPWTAPPFVPSELQAAWNRGAVPMITWEPWSWGSHSRHFGLAAIARGRYDAYVRRAAKAAAAWGHPLLLRFAHEMNGTWYPWGSGRNGNTPAAFRRAWKHLVGVFRRSGAGNVEWVWAPNVNNGGRFPFQRLYPGDRWVDWVGLDGFNWAMNGNWSSFTSTFADSYEQLGRITRRPVIITETASNQSGGDKAAWVSSALRREIPRFSAVRAVVWFTEPFNGVEARIDSSPDALRAFRRAADSPLYSLTRRELLATPAVLPRPAAAPEPPSGGFGEPSLAYRITHKLHGRYLWYAVGIGLLAIAVLALGFVLIRRRRRGRGPR